MKTEKEIETLINESIDTPKSFLGMSYLDGVRVALEWVLGECAEDEGPLD